MNNETKILAMSLLAILEGFENSVRLGISENLTELRDYNKEFIKETDSDGEEISIIKDEKLQKVILNQEQKLKSNIKDRENRVSEVMRNNSDKVKVINEILKEVLEKPKDSNVNF